jgi:HTH-type transcriptional regulator, quorum sensing regulator NprR
LLIGNRIKYLREKKNLTLDSVSKGIISSSHLSNIENGRHLPPLDVLMALAKKLSVPEYYLVKHQNTSYNLEKLLKEAAYFIHRDLEKTKSILEIISDSDPYISSTYQEFFYCILRCLYLLKNGEKNISFNQIENGIISKTSIDSDEFEVLSPTILKEVVYYTYGLYYFHKQNFSNSIIYFLKCKATKGNSKISNINYNISLCYWKNGQLSAAIQHLQDALIDYYNNHEWENVGDVYNYLGILYTECGVFDKAIETFKKHFELPTQNDSKKAKVLHNLGNAYFKQGKYTESENYLTEAIKVKKTINSEKMFISLKLLTDLYIIQQDLKEARHLLLENQKYAKYFIEINLLKLQEGKLFLLEGDYNKFILFTTEAITNLKLKGYFHEIIEPCKALANYYQKKYKYKQATYYYSLVVESLEKANWR